VDEVVASWSGVNLAPFPGIPMHESKEAIIEDKLTEWLGGEIEKPSEQPVTTPRKLSLIGALPLIGTRSSFESPAKVT